MVARSAAGLKSPKIEVFLDFRSQKGPKSDLIYLSMGGVRIWEERTPVRCALPRRAACAELGCSPEPRLDERRELGEPTIVSQRQRVAALIVPASGGVGAAAVYSSCVSGGAELWC